MKKIILLSLFLFVSVFVKAADDPAIHTKEFKDALTYLVAYQLYWNALGMTGRLLGYDEEGSAWTIYPLLGKTIHGKIKKYGNYYCVTFKDLSNTSLSEIWLSHEKDGSWKKPGLFKCPETEILAAADYKFKIPADFVGIVSKFGKDTGPVIEKSKIFLKKLIDEDDNAGVGTHHFFIGPFSSYVFPGYADIVIYWKEGNRFIWLKPGKDEGAWSYTDFDIESFSYHEGFYCPTQPDNEELTEIEFEKAKFSMRVFSTNFIIGNCLRDGLLVTIEKTKPPDKGPFKK